MHKCKLILVQMSFSVEVGKHWKVFFTAWFSSVLDSVGQIWLNSLGRRSTSVELNKLFVRCKLSRIKSRTQWSLACFQW